MKTIQSPTVIVTENQRRQLDEDGFFITPVVFDEATLATVRREFERMWQEDIAKAEKSGDAGAIEWGKVRQFMDQLDHRNEVCRAFCLHPVFGDLCQQLLGPDADLNWNQAIIKAAMPKQRDASTRDNLFAWHQDIWYALNGPYINDVNADMLRAPDNAITAWVAITRTTVDNGTLWVLPGQHKRGLVHHNWHTERREWQAQVDTAYKIPVVLRAGQVLVFRKYLPHSSGTNLSDETRMAYQIGYTQLGLNLQPSPNFTPLLRDGKLVCGTHNRRVAILS